MIRRRGRPGLVGLAARTAVVAGTATAVSGAMVTNQHAKAQQQAELDAHRAAQQQAALDDAARRAIAEQSGGVAAPAAPAPVAAPPAADLLTQLTQLGELREKGLLTDEEFAAAKAKLLG